MTNPQHPGNLDLTLVLQDIAAAIRGSDGSVSSGTNSGSGGGSTNYIRLGNLVVSWGLTNTISINAGGVTNAFVNFPVTYNSPPSVTAMPSANTAIAGLVIYQQSVATTSTASLTVHNPGGAAATARVDWIAVGLK